MTDEKTPLDQAIELLVFAPIGLALTARDELPKLIERGRQQVTGQVGMARMIGQFAVSQGQREAEKLVKEAGNRLGELGLTGRPAAPARPAPSASSTVAAAPTASTVGGHSSNGSHAGPDDSGRRDNGPRAGVTSTPSTAASIDPDDHLAIPGYGSLSASQVVPRLAGLSADELEAVRHYESGNRARKTILHRISQLQAGTS